MTCAAGGHVGNVPSARRVAQDLDAGRQAEGFGHAVGCGQDEAMRMQRDAGECEADAGSQTSHDIENPTVAVAARIQGAHGRAVGPGLDGVPEAREGGLYTLARMQLPSEQLPLRIHVVEDDDDIREETVFALGELGFDAVGFGNAASFYKAMAVAPCDIAVVDIGLPGESGLTIVAHLRTLHSFGVVLFTARSTLDDRVAGLREGADAYLVKPVDMVELAETLKAVGRRLRASPVASPPATAPDPGAAAVGAPAQWSLHEGGWVLSDPQGRRMTLTATEHVWLGCLIQRRGSAVSRDDLIAALGGDVFDFDQHRIDAIASRLRRKADRLGMRLPVHAVRGTGYVFAS